MTNTTLLRKKITDSGLKMTYIARELGISRYQLWKKIENKVMFNQYEIEKLCSLLGVKTLTERHKLFFAQNVD